MRSQICINFTVLWNRKKPISFRLVVAKSFDTYYFSTFNVWFLHHIPFEMNLSKFSKSSLFCIDWAYQVDTVEAGWYSEV